MLFWDWVAWIWTPTYRVIVRKLSEPNTKQGWPGPCTDVFGHSKSEVSMSISGISADGLKSIMSRKECDCGRDDGFRKAMAL